MSGEVLEGEVVEDVTRLAQQHRLLQAGPWQPVGEPESMCRCGHTIESEHDTRRCVVVGCDCRELRPWAEIRLEQRQVIVPWTLP